MTKQEFLAKVRELYAVGNRSDSHDNPLREDWTRPAMASDACCGALDDMLTKMTAEGVLTVDEYAEFYDTL